MIKKNRALNHGFLLLEVAGAIFLISLLMISFSEVFFGCSASILKTKEKACAFNIAQTYAEILTNIEDEELFNNYSDGSFERDDFYVETHVDVITERKGDNDQSKGSLKITVLVTKNGRQLAEIKTFRKARWRNEK